MAIEVENNSLDTYSIYPLLGMLITNTKEQIEPDLMLSDGVRGEFIGKGISKGTVVFMLDSKAQDIEKIRYIINGPEDESTNLIGKEIEFEIEF